MIVYRSSFKLDVMIHKPQAPNAAQVQDQFTDCSGA